MVVFRASDGLGMNSRWKEGEDHSFELGFLEHTFYQMMTNLRWLVLITDEEKT